MAVTQNTYTGNGSTVLFSFTFPYLETTDIKVSVNGTNTTAYTLANPTTVQFNAAPANGAAIRIYRQTDDVATAATFYPGSSIRAQDLNDNFIQNLYVTQESKNEAASATSVANSASTSAAQAVSTSQTAATNAATALSASQTASTNAASAVSTSQTAANNAATALSTANTAAANAATALSTANTSLANSQTATTNAATALSNSQTSLTQSQTALTTANSASTTATNAASTASSSSSTAATALSTANTANSKADQAIAAVSNSINFQLKANVAAIPATPANDTYIEVQNSTGLESFTPLAGMPAGFVGDAGLSVRLRYTTAGSTWNWLNYYANNSETRYLKLTGGTLTGNITLAGAPSSNLHPATKAYVDGYVNAINGDIASLGSTKLDSSTAASTYLTQANAASTYQTQAGMSSYLTTANAASTYLTQANASSTYAPTASPTFTGTVTIPAGASISGYLTTASAASTYQTQAGMSGYLATGAIGTTVQAYDANTAKTNVAQSYSAAQRGTHVTLTDGATITPDFAAGNHFTVTLGGNRTLANPTNLTAGQSGVIYVVQDGTGSRTLSYGTNWDFAGGTVPTLSTAANSVDVIAYAVRSNSSIAATLIKDVK